MPRRILQGTVVSDKADKTVVVSVERRVMHPIYKKFIRRSKRYAAHDADNRLKVGDVVRIPECRPISRSLKAVSGSDLRQRRGAAAGGGEGLVVDPADGRTRPENPEINLEVADNSGARRVQCIRVLGGSHRAMGRWAT